MKVPRVLHIIRINKGGAATVAEQLVRELDRKWYEPMILYEVQDCSINRKRIANEKIKIFALKKEIDSNSLVSINLHRQRDIGGWLETHLGKSTRQCYFSLKASYKFVRQQVPMIRVLVRFIREKGINLVHTHNDLSSGKPHILAAGLAGVPCISHFHRFSKLTSFDKIFAKFVDSFVYVSNALAEHYIAQGMPSEKGKIIHNGVDLAEFETPYDPEEVRSEFKCNPDELLVGIIGRIDSWKGQDYFIEAISKASKKIPKLRGLIIGELGRASVNQNYMHKLQSLVESYGLQDKIIFTGFRNDVPRLISGLDLVVHASSEPEPFGLVVVESMAAGKPPVATAAGGVLDIIEDGLNGILVPCKDSEALSRAIVHLISSPSRIVRMGQAARQRVIDNFTVHHQVTAIEELYNNLLNHGYIRFS